MTSPILYDNNYKCNKFASFQQIILIYVLYRSWIIKIKIIEKNNGEIYYFNAYNDVIDDFIAIYSVLEMALSSMIYI